MGGRAKQTCIVTGFLFAVALAGSGCTTLQSTQLPPDELRYGIRSGSLVQPGDEISVVTVDGKDYSFTVGHVGEDEIRGELAGAKRWLWPSTTWWRCVRTRLRRCVPLSPSSVEASD